MLARFNVILATDREGGIGKNGDLPWDRVAEDMNWFYEHTTKSTSGLKNAIIMGRKTHESISMALPNRLNVVVSKTLSTTPDITVVKSFEEGLLHLAKKISRKEIDKVFVIGGGQLYDLAMGKYIYLCDYIYHTLMKTKCSCDVSVSLDFTKYEKVRETKSYPSCSFNVYRPGIVHHENGYLALLSQIKSCAPRDNRTAVRTVGNFFNALTFDVSNGKLPLITTKYVSFDNVLKELLWFISGYTDSKKLETLNVNIWKENTSKEFLAKRSLSYREGDAGPIYGFQWRHWGASYQGCDMEYNGQGVDQIKNVIKQIIDDPYSRRHVVCAWNVSDIDKMALPPCHLLFQFYVEEEHGKPAFLSCSVTMRSSDVFLGLPYNIASYSILLHMIAHLTNLKAKKIHFALGDTHVYVTHLKQAEEQLKRTPYPFPNIKFVEPYKIRSIEDFTLENVKCEDYIHHEKINAKMVV